MSFSKSQTAALALLVGLGAVTQLACYNTYTIDNNELSKLEASVERYETVEVLADCPEQEASEEANVGGLHGQMYAAADDMDEGAVSDGMIKRVEEDDLRGCTLVPVSTVNALTVLTADGRRERVTPFNFAMDEVQLVSPEYNLLLSLDNVEGAEVREFSTWKTVGTIAGVTLLTVGGFVGISVLAPEEEGF